MKVSVCIPNFNYGNYIGETIDSVLNQDYKDVEVLISDNNSTDNSWEVIQEYVKKDARVKAHQNVTNLGFAGNLDPASANASGDVMILLSSDDVMNPGALSIFKKLKDIEGDNFAIAGTGCQKIDSEGKDLEYMPPPRKLWFESDIDTKLTEQIGYKVYKVKSGELLKRSMETFMGPLYFLATIYTKKVYEKAGGYSGSRLYNPDKWFHWKVLGETEYCYFIDYPFFGYRWHQNNQLAQQNRIGALKYYLDEYRATFESSKEMLQNSKVSDIQLQTAYIKNVIHKQAFRKLKIGHPMDAFRILSLGFASYPSIMFKSKTTYILFLLNILGKLSYYILKPFKKNFLN
jgi:glycosyltransferase involved in cell wall biosynthesis